MSWLIQLSKMISGWWNQYCTQLILSPAAMVFVLKMIPYKKTRKELDGLHNLNLFPSGFSFTDTDDLQNSRRREEPSLFLSTICAHSRTLRHLFATLHVRWLPQNFIFIIYNYQTATQWDIPPYWITIIEKVSISVICLMIYF